MSAVLGAIWRRLLQWTAAQVEDCGGLGKTIQMLAALLRHQQRAAKEPPSTPSLLVVPASLIGNWNAEVERFTPSLKVLVAHPSDAAYALLAEQAKAPARLLRDVDLVITTYSMAARLDWLKQRLWQWVILDEVQAIKNPSARQTRAVKQLRGLARVALTGTPVENRLGDLWSIFDFLNPGLLGSATRFKAFARSLESREQARREVAKQNKKGRNLQPVNIAGCTIARSF